jgi:hypothetical protein
MVDKLIDYTVFDNEQLLDIWAVYRVEYDQTLTEMNVIKAILDHRMKGNNSKVIPHDRVSVEMGPPTAIIDRLMGLKEVVGETEFKRAFTPAHIEETEIPDKISLTVVNGWAKQGDHVREMIAYGTDNLSARLTLKLKKPVKEAEDAIKD